MKLKRNGSVLVNTDYDAYIIAKKQRELHFERIRKDKLLESLNERVIALEAEVAELKEMLSNTHDIS